MKESFSFFRAPITNTDPCREIGAEEVVKYLRSSYARERTESVRAAQGEARRRAKGERLDYVTFSGSFASRRTGGLIHHSGLMCFDLDHIESPEETRQQLAEDENLQPLIMFVSPSGDGLKIVVRTDSAALEEVSEETLARRHRTTYSHIAKYLKKRHGLTCDKTNDIARPCYLCHDENTYYNPEAGICLEREDETCDTSVRTASGRQRFWGRTHPRCDIAVSQPFTPERPPYRPPSGNREKRDPQDWVEQMTAELEQSGKNIAEEYDQWVKIGFALADGLGETGREYYHRISAMSTKYSADATDRKYDECMRHRGRGVGLGTLYYYVKN